MISIVIPAYNEEEAIGQVIYNIKSAMKKTKYKYEIIVVDDGSTDRTVEIAKKLKVSVYSHPYNIGYGGALKTGIKNAKGDYILIIDSDGTYPTNEIPKLLKYTDKYDMVVGARIGKDVKIPLFRRPAKFVLSKLANYLTNTKIPDLNSGLRIFKRDVVFKFFNILPSGFSFPTTITLAYLSNGYFIKFVPISYYERRGRSKIKPFRDTFNFVLLIIKTVTYFNPLKVFLPTGIVLFLSALFLFIYSVFYLHKIMDISVIILTVAAIQVAFFGLLADMLSRKEVK